MLGLPRVRADSFAVGPIPRSLLRLSCKWAGEKLSGERLRPAGCPRRLAAGFRGVGGTLTPAPETGALLESK
jgi:hypothetical protein